MTGPLSQIVRPLYGAASLADVLPSALAALGVPGEPDVLGLRSRLAGVGRLAVLLVDGFGWHQLAPAAATGATIADIVAGRLGSAQALTCGFPSTTPTSLVSLGTGVAPGRHGVVGFTVKVPETSRVLTHIDWDDDPDPATWQPVPTAFDRAAAAGVAATVVHRPEFRGSGLSVSAYRGADDSTAASTVDELAAAMLAGLARTPLVYGYHGDLDKIGHLCGVDSAPWRAAAADVDRLLTLLVDGLPSDAALVVTADHGQLDVPAQCRLDMGTDPRLQAGVSVVAGEPRVRYLHTVPGANADVLDAWRAVLGDRAWVVPRDEAVADGWFGPVPESHLARIGDVVVACRDRFAVLATGTDHDMVGRLIAYHGSFTAVEMEIPLIVVPGRRVG